MNNIEKGKLGEEIARNYLISKDYTILSTNYRNDIGEIDIIARTKNILVFLEVKTRSSTNYGYGYEAVNKKKQDKILRTSFVYLKLMAYSNEQTRYDIVEVYLNDKKINHIENAFSGNY